jgi:demethylmenaquinone methyltransferase/2-methoxy-6-polyprenyl-1,4-benzoquinol methylase
MTDPWRMRMAPTEGMTCFGFRKVPENDKAGWVKDHFDLIARRYDMMNTLARLGIHYLWKREAVNMLRAKPGDHVIDVCGGTGDLSVLALSLIHI